MSSGVYLEMKSRPCPEFGLLLAAIMQGQILLGEGATF